MNKAKKAIYSWALYDWANSAFSTTVMAGFFPVFFKKYYASGMSITDSTALLGITSSLITIAVSFSAPFLGVLSDLLPLKKKLVFQLALMGSIMTALLGIIPEGWALWACFIYGLAAYFQACSFAPYDALLSSVTLPNKEERVSSFGYAVGYLGGGLLFIFNLLLLLKPSLFFLSSKVEAIKVSFISVSIWWIVFTFPLMKNVEEKTYSTATRFEWSIFFKNLKDLFLSFRDLKGHKNVWIFLIAFLLYNDGLGTVIKMAVDYGLSIGLPENSLMIALLVVQFVGFPGTIFLGRVAERYHPKLGIVIGILIYMVVLTWATFMKSQWEFYAIAVLIGCAQGGVQALSRSYYLRLIPQEKVGEFFGFYNLLGKFAGFMGPLLVAGTAYFSGDSRSSLFVVNLLFLPGALLLLRVKEGKTSNSD